MNDEIDPLTAAAAAATASNDAGGGNNNNDDASSVSSQRSAGGRSLLERIQMQREREAAAASAAASTSDYKAMMTSTTPQQIQIPNYGQSMPGFGNNSNVGIGNQNNGASSPANDGGVSTNFLSNTWSNLSQSAAGDSSFSMSPMPESAPHSLEDGMNDALLPPSSAGGMPRHDEDYSMSDYFMTFVKDVTGLFSRLHIVPRILLFVALLYVAIKLL